MKKDKVLVDRRLSCWLGLILLLFVNANLYAQSDLFTAPERGFTSWLPAPNWEHGLLSGNGTMGALVFGHPHEETIIVSHGQLFLPQDRSDSIINQAARLDEIRQLIKEGKYEAAANIPVELREKEGYSDQRDPFIPAFDIKIEQEAANIKHYQRSTNFETGEAKVTWEDDLGTFQRKLFVSRTDSVMVLSIKSEAPINCTINFERRPVEWNQWSFVGEHVDEMKSSASENWLSYHSTFKKKYPGSITGYEGLGKLILKDGTSKVEGNKLKIEGAHELLLLVKVGLNYDGNSSASRIKNELNEVSGNYENLLKSHQDMQGEMFSRVRLNLHSNSKYKDLNTEELILKAKQEGVSKALIEKVFDAGRYNILSSTGANPPNLQGLWSGTWTAPWAADYTHDGNLPSAMASVMSGNMPELMATYVKYMERYLSDFEINADRLYGARGIHLPVHTTTSGFPTDFNETWCLTLWTGGAGWAADIMYNYYLYTGDKQYLKDHAYPWFKKTAWFYEHFLQEDNNGQLIFNPSYSPENNPANGKSQAVLNATMDVMIARQVLKHAIEAGKLLGETKSQLKIWEDMLTKLPDYKVNNDGVLSEWLWPGMEDNYRHRHVSQLYSLYNYMDSDILENEKLKQGAKKLIDKKLDFRNDEGGGEMAFGLVQLGLSAAHMRDSKRAYEAVKWLSTKYWSTGMGSFHNVGALLNTDISGGLPAVIIEMLVYSEKGKIVLLPALPNEWNEGELEGALLRGQIKLEQLKWSGKNIFITLSSQKKQKVVVELPQNIKKMSSGVVKTKQLSGNQVEVTLPAAKSITLSFEME